MHVVAASDSEADQALKIKVRDAAMREVEAALSGCGDIYEARMAIKMRPETMPAIIAMSMLIARRLPLFFFMLFPPV